MNNEKINMYTCINGHKLVTIDRHEGVIPMKLRCTKHGCGEMSTSAFYQVEPGLTPTHEWYAPTEEELASELLKFEYRNPGDGSPEYQIWLNANIKGFRNHVAQGGLLIREIETVKA